LAVSYDILEPGLRVNNDYDFGEPSVKAPNWVFDVGELLVKGSYRYFTLNLPVLSLKEKDLPNTGNTS
jgi:hypothetical protein